MPTKTEKAVAAAAALPSIPKELIDQFCSGPMTGEAVNAATTAFKKALIERALGGELSHHLGYARGDDKPEQAANHRNGASGKGGAHRPRGRCASTCHGDRAGSFEPVLIPKHERRFHGL